MKHTQENLEFQYFTTDDILAALLTMDDLEAREALMQGSTINNLLAIFNTSTYSIDDYIEAGEITIARLEAAYRGLRLLADILQVPDGDEGLYL